MVKTARLRAAPTLVPLGVLAAVYWFKERLPPLRLGAIAIMLTGLALVAW